MTENKIIENNTTTDDMKDIIKSLKEKYYLIVLNKRSQVIDAATKSNISTSCEDSDEEPETINQNNSATKSNISTSCEDNSNVLIKKFNESLSTQILKKIIQNASKIQYTDKIEKMLLDNDITEITKLNNYIKSINELIKDYQKIDKVVNKNTIEKMISRYNTLKQSIISEYTIPNELSEEYYYFKLINTLNNIGNKINKLNKLFNPEETSF